MTSSAANRPNLGFSRLAMSRLFHAAECHMTKPNLQTFEDLLWPTPTNGPEKPPRLRHHSGALRGRIWRVVLVLGAIVLASTPAEAQAGVDLYIYGGRNNETFLGCITCSRYDTRSVFNRYGPNGSRYAADSIFNNYGQFGSRYSRYSPCSRYASDPPVVVDGSGRFYGYLTVNPYRSGRVVEPSLLALLNAACED